MDGWKIGSPPFPMQNFKDSPCSGGCDKAFTAQRGAEGSDATADSMIKASMLVSGLEGWAPSKRDRKRLVSARYRCAAGGLPEPESGRCSSRTVSFATRKSSTSS